MDSTGNSRRLNIHAKVNNYYLRISGYPLFPFPFPSLLPFFSLILGARNPLSGGFYLAQPSYVTSWISSRLSRLGISLAERKLIKNQKKSLRRKIFPKYFNTARQWMQASKRSLDSQLNDWPCSCYALSYLENRGYSNNLIFKFW